MEQIFFFIIICWLFKHKFDAIKINIRINTKFKLSGKNVLLKPKSSLHY